jgi:hypothetical protein
MLRERRFISACLATLTIAASPTAYAKGGGPEIAGAIYAILVAIPAGILVLATIALVVAPKANRRWALVNFVLSACVLLIAIGAYFDLYLPPFAVNAAIIISPILLLLIVVSLIRSTILRFS